MQAGGYTIEMQLGIIGGSGVYELPELKIIEEIQVQTPFGEPSSPVVVAELHGHRACFLPRHGRNHQFSPSEVNYRANIFAFKKLGVKTIVSVSAVGSLKDEWAPETFVLPDQFIDWTKGRRERTFFTDGIVGHVSVAQPVNLLLRERIASACEIAGIQYAKGGAYICIEGPQFSSKAESNIYRGFGADVIGMTNVPESYLAKEANIAYATVAMVTDYDCWKEKHCRVEEIMKVMEMNNVNVRKLMSVLVPELVTKSVLIDDSIDLAVVTKEKALSQKHKKIVAVLSR